jgi:hypothetical protein
MSEKYSGIDRSKLADFNPDPPGPFVGEEVWKRIQHKLTRNWIPKFEKEVQPKEIRLNCQNEKDAKDLFEYIDDGIDSNDWYPWNSMEVEKKGSTVRLYEAKRGQVPSDAPKFPKAWEGLDSKQLAEKIQSGIGSKTSGPQLIKELKDTGFKVKPRTVDGYMMLDDIGGDFSTWEAEHEGRKVYIFWSMEWWILDVSDKPIKPSDYK